MENTEYIWKRFPCLDEPKMCFLTAMQLHREHVQLHATVLPRSVCSRHVNLEMMEDGQINLIPDVRLAHILYSHYQH